MNVVFVTLFFLKNLLTVLSNENDIPEVFNFNIIKTPAFVYWKNATVPFYITHEHFDDEQKLAIMKTLSMFAFKTCVKFFPVMVEPSGNEHVLTFINPEGTRRCIITTDGHSIDEPHYVTLGYDCIKSPNIEMIVMRALGFPFEHTRITRDQYIEVLKENIEPASMELFTKGDFLSPELRRLPYDYNSVMHFGERDFSKNGHRTIIFKHHDFVQNRHSLTQIDLKKFDLVYGPECQKRDRQEKVDLCQGYPGVARKKRETDGKDDKPGDRAKREAHEGQNHETNTNNKELGEDLMNFRRKRHSIQHEDGDIKVKKDKKYTVDNFTFRRKRSLPNEPSQRKSLRVNPNITPPPEVLSNLTYSLRELGIEGEVQELIDKVHKVTSLALKNAREKYCNTTERPPVEMTKSDLKDDNIDILGVVETVADYAASVVSSATNNLTAFCEVSDSIDAYQRQRCSFNDGSGRCRSSYRSTKSGLVRHSTRHRPIHVQPTRHEGRGIKYQYDKMFRAGDNTTETQLEITTEMSKAATESIKTTVQAVNEKVDNNTKETQIRRKRDVEAQEDATVLLEPNKEKSTKWVKMIMAEKPKRTDKEKDLFKRSSKQSDSSAEDNWDSSKVSLEHDTNGRESSAKREVKEEKEMVALKESESEKDIKDDDRSSPERSEKKFSKDRYTEKKPRIKLPKTVQLSKANDEFYTERMWPSGVVLYVIKPEPTYDLDDLRARLEEVNHILQKKTCVRLKEMTEEAAENYEDYLVLDTSQDYVTGRVSGKQQFGSIELFQGNQHRQHTAMMVMAMLGFYFEVSRHDRDKHVRVHMRHIRPDKLHHFEKIRDDATLPLPYDYKSATHPAWQFWRKIGKTGISTVATYKEQDPDGSVMKALGQNDRLLSDIDIIKINSVYGVKCFEKKRAVKKVKKSEEAIKENYASQPRNSVSSETE